jgi:hypothetical protein
MAADMWIDRMEAEQEAAGARGMTLEEMSAHCRMGRRIRSRKMEWELELERRARKAARHGAVE